MQLVEKKISREDLIKISGNHQDDFVKAVVDLEKEIMVIDSALHSDEEMFLLDNGSVQNDLWGINIYPNRSADRLVEFDSMINIRPRDKNRTRGVDNPQIRIKIIEIVGNLIQ